MRRRKDEYPFRGWREVFLFTARQIFRSKGFRVSTIVIGLLCLLAGILINVCMAYSQKKNATEVSPIETVYVVNESGLGELYMDGFLQEYGKTYPKLCFEDIESTTLEECLVHLGKLGAAAAGVGQALPLDVVLRVTEGEGGYLMELIIPYNCAVTETQGKALLEDLQLVLEQSKLLTSGIDAQKLQIALGSVVTTTLDAGEQEKSLAEELVSMLVPMLCILALYFMNLVYGQNIGHIVSVEKSSKLMEMLLTMTKPYGLIFGKIFAVSVLAVCQMGLWICVLAGGFFAGDILSRAVIYEGYQNQLFETLAFLKLQQGSTAFTSGAVILAFLTACLAFLFYCSIAGLVASFAGKAEELAQTMSYYQILMLAGFFGAYMLPLQGKNWLNTVLRIIPLTGAYLLPGDILVGNITVLQGAGYVTILLLATLVILLCAGRVYRNEIFFKGRRRRC